METEILKEILKKEVDEVQFLELMDITMEELVDKFEEEIVEKEAHLLQQLELDNPRPPEGSVYVISDDRDNDYIDR